MRALKHAFDYLQNKANATEPLYQLKTTAADNIVHIAIHDKGNNRSGEIRIEKALHSHFQKTHDFTDKQMNHVAIIHDAIFSDAKSQSLLPILSYFALRQARIWNCYTVIAPTQYQSLLKLSPLSFLPTIFSQQLSYAIFQAYEACNATEHTFIQTYFIHEILTTFQIWVENLFQNSWFRAIKTRTLTKEQYIITLYNLHAFVKYTTRLAARCVAYSDSRELRNHYINHLKGEVNHEVIIESDLRALHADVDYLINAHVAHPATNAFMTLQESVIGYKQNSALMLACPFIAEGMTANINSTFVTDLHETIKSWGVKSPDAASRFLTSHMKTDGGDDGHWIRVIMMIDKVIETEKQQREFLAIMNLATSSYGKGLGDNVDDYSLYNVNVNAKESLAINH
ncbi:MAG TPA: hypothetical protein VJK30_00270 [Coxiellaceae bacterium]|nr:MAG: hypothetical protein A3E81_08460 [Gammaproteobacteria bacterium RIFCSPHIGHO2_12_FULL_36_30]HLB55751.1 hypothetical protein [Coxiellaceae bacterium]